MKRAITLFLAGVGAFVVLGMTLVLFTTWVLFSPGSLPDRIVVEFDLADGLVEAFPADPLLLAFERRRLRTRDVVEALDRAASDPRVAGLLVRGGGPLAGWGMADEVRDAVLRFRASGKPALYQTDTFGELTPGQLGYHLATAFDEIYLQPSGEVGLAPLLMEGFFLGDAFEKLGVDPRFDRRWEYKDAQELFTETGFTEPARQAREAVLRSLEGELTGGIAAGRSLAPDSARSLLAGGPYPAREALAAGLVDGLAYADEVLDRMEELVEGTPTLMGVAAYLDRAGGAWASGPRVAVIHAGGAIARGRGGLDFLSGGSSVGAATLARSIRMAVADPSVRAILFRVDSPGGSWAASDQIRHEIRRARDGGIPVVVSMADFAASGGYAIAMDADRIVAHPSTLTGSIGVLGGKLITEEFWSSLGVEWDRVQVTDGGDYYSGIVDYSPEQWDRFQLFLDRIYEDFTAGVAEGRGMSPLAVEAVARGRLWSGRDAVSLGLVDRLGGYQVALEEVRELLGEEVGAPLTVVTFPAERSLLELILEEVRGGGGGGSGVRAGDAISGLLSPIRGALSMAARAGFLGEEGQVRVTGWGSTAGGVPGQ